MILKTLKSLEGVADGQVESQGVAERGHVVVASAAGVPRGVDADAEVGADHEHADVEAQTGSGAEGKVAQERAGAQCAAGTLRIRLEQPHIAGIEEYGAVERAEDREAVLGVELDLKRTGLVEVAVGGGWRMIATRTDGTYRESAYGVGATHPELLTVGYLRGITVSMRSAYSRTAHEPVVAKQTVAVDQLRGCLDKL